MSGVVGRLKDMPVNARSVLNDFIKRSAAEAVLHAPQRFGHSNRKMLKGLGSGVRGLGSRLRRRK
jgi:hypothetical protein